MLNKSTQSIVTALVMSAVLIGLAFYQRHGGPIRLPEVTFFIVIAIFYVSPVAYRALRCKSWGNKASNVG